MKKNTFLFIPILYLFVFIYFFMEEISYQPNITVSPCQWTNSIHKEGVLCGLGQIPHTGQYVEMLLYSTNKI